jgi:hypothetical protein
LKTILCAAGSAVTAFLCLSGFSPRLVFCRHVGVCSFLCSLSFLLTPPLNPFLHPPLILVELSRLLLQVVNPSNFAISFAAVTAAASLVSPISPWRLQRLPQLLMQPASSAKVGGKLSWRMTGHTVKVLQQAAGSQRAIAASHLRA